MVIGGNGETGAIFNSGSRCQSSVVLSFGRNIIIF